MTATIIEPDTDIFEMLDFEFEPPCESVLGCDRTATWRVVMACCGAAFLFCDSDWHAIDRYMNVSGNGRHSIHDIDTSQLPACRRYVMSVSGTRL